MALTHYPLTNISFNDVYMRTGDDAIAIYGSRFNGGMTWTGNSSNISVTNSILMPDVAHPINIGTHGDPTAPGGGYTIDNDQLFEYGHLRKLYKAIVLYP